MNLFSHKFKLVHYSARQELRQFYSHLFFGYSGGPLLLLTYMARIRGQDFKSV